MKSAYALAMEELNLRQEKNKAEMEMRHGEVLIKVPEMAKVEAELTKEGTKLLRAVLDGGRDFDKIKSEIQSLQEKKKRLLNENGFGEDYLKDICSCEKCRDTGFVDGLRCDCHKILINKYIAKNSNLSELMRKQTFENFDMGLFDGDEKVERVMKKACLDALEFSNNFDEEKSSLLIMGAAGTGKTFLSSCIANRALERGKTVYYVSAFQIFDMFEKIHFEKGNTEELLQTEKYINDADLLIIDDLGTEFVTQFTAAALFNLVNSRLIEEKSTVISTNLGKGELADLYSQRIASRLTGEYKVILTLGKDLR